MKVLVTGGAGFIGSHIVDALVMKGHDVAIIDDMSNGHSINVNKSAKLYEVDVRDFKAVESVFVQERPDIVDHHAAQISLRESMADPGYDAHNTRSVRLRCSSHQRQRLVRRLRGKLSRPAASPH